MLMAQKPMLVMTSAFISLAPLAACGPVADVVNRVSLVQESLSPHVGPASDSQPPSTTDSVCLLQSLPVVDRLSVYDQELATLREDTDTSSNKAPAAPKPQGLLASGAARMQDVVSKRIGARASTGMLVLVMLTLCFFCTIAGFLFPSLFNRRQQQDVAGGGQSVKDIAVSLETRDRMGAYSSPLPMYQRAVSGASPVATQPFLGAASSPHISPHSDISLPDPRTSMTSLISITEQKRRQSARPPALCPTLVMPMTEALLGIPMHELARLNPEGTLNIAGISGKSLLRAEVKKSGNARSVAISMPEPNSIPRALVGPPMSGDSKSHGSGVLEIQGRGGVVYGTVEMCSSGTCFVVKDGQTVLTIDGDAESLQLALKSSQGLQLAAVRCSTEQFEGVDFVEVRIEPGVDTVLIMAVVLAVLLLSPYLAPSDD